MPGIGLERLLDELDRFVAEAAVDGREQVGVVGEQIGVVGKERSGAIEGARGLLIAVERLVRAREHHPPIDIRRLVLEPRRELLRQRLDFLPRDLVLAGRLSLRGKRRECVVVSQPEIKKQGSDGNGAAEDRRGPRRRLRGSRRGSFDALRLFERPLQELLLRLLVAIARDRAGGEIGVELAQLVAQNRHIDRFARDTRRAAAQQRDQHRGEGNGHHSDGDQDEQRHARSFPPSPPRSRDARSRSSSVSGGVSGSVRRARTR
jgi:hypothetical protein